MNIKTRLEKLESMTGSDVARIIVIEGQDEESATAKWLLDNRLEKLPKGNVSYLTIRFVTPGDKI